MAGLGILSPSWVQPQSGPSNLSFPISSQWQHPHAEEGPADVCLWVWAWALRPALHAAWLLAAPQPGGKGGCSGPTACMTPTGCHLPECLQQHAGSPLQATTMASHGQEHTCTLKASLWKRPPNSRVNELALVAADSVQAKHPGSPAWAPAPLAGQSP